LKNSLGIYISNADGAAIEVKKRPHALHVISIRDYRDKTAPVDKVAGLCLSMLVLRFNDLDDVRLSHLSTADLAKHGLHYPERGHIEAALDYAKDKQELLIHCAAGVSRSSAVAYLIACSRVGTMEALKVLDSLFHWPNNRVVRLGAEIMGDSEIEQTIKKWKDDYQLNPLTKIVFPEKTPCEGV
jgi:predicted protein tyrosine phosphatase